MIEPNLPFPGAPAGSLLSGPFEGLLRNHHSVILADPPWHFKAWSDKTGGGRSPSRHYSTMTMADIAALPVADLAADDCALFCWATWPTLPDALRIVGGWGFTYKTCAFVWVKGEERPDGTIKDQVGLGYWTRANTEPCILATRGKPKRINADVRQVILEKRREHSRKPTDIHARIERLVPGPYVELFARAPQAGWTVWGNETDKFEEVA